MKRHSESRTVQESVLTVLRQRFDLAINCETVEELRALHDSLSWARPNLQVFADIAAEIEVLAVTVQGHIASEVWHEPQ